MKIYQVISVITITVLPFLLPAQSFRGGLIAGVSATQISGDQLGGFDKAGLVAGGMVSMNLGKKTDLAMEILYFQKGSKKNPNPDIQDYTSYLLRLSYFEMPLMAQWHYSKRFTFEAGLTFGALLKEYEEDELGELPERTPFNKFEFGIAGGMKVNFAKQFSFVSRIESSLIPVREHSSGQEYRLNHGHYNAALVFGAQYIFKKRDE